MCHLYTALIFSHAAAQLGSIIPSVMMHLADILDTLSGPSLRQHFSKSSLAKLNAGLHQAQQGLPALSLPFVIQLIPPGAPFPLTPAFATKALGALGILVEISGDVEGE
jgi:hypothetical protein